MGHHRLSPQTTSPHSLFFLSFSLLFCHSGEESESCSRVWARAEVALGWVLRVFSRILAWPLKKGIGAFTESLETCWVLQASTLVSGVPLKSGGTYLLTNHATHPTKALQRIHQSCVHSLQVVSPSFAHTWVTCSDNQQKVSLQLQTAEGHPSAGY